MLSKIKLLAIILSIIVAVNFFLMVFRMISLKTFWFVIILMAFLAYIVLPRLKTHKL